MMLAMRGVVLALLVLCTVPGSHSPTMCIEGGSQNCPWLRICPWARGRIWMRRAVRNIADPQCNELHIGDPGVVGRPTCCECPLAIIVGICKFSRRRLLFADGIPER